MKQIIYVSSAVIKKVRSVHRSAKLRVGGTIDFGVHGPIKKHYNLNDEKDLPLPVDYIVAATGG